MADDILRQGVQGITDLITVPGLVNLDFADVRTIMRDAGSALMGIGAASGENRAAEAARTAVSSPLLEASIDGATGILLNITGGSDLGLFEVNEAAEVVTSAADRTRTSSSAPSSTTSLGDEVRVTVIATGFGAPPSGAGPRRGRRSGEPPRDAVQPSPRDDPHGHRARDPVASCGRIERRGLRSPSGNVLQMPSARSPGSRLRRPALAGVGVRPCPTKPRD